MEENKGKLLWEIEEKDGFYITKSLEGALAQTAANYGIIFTALYPSEIMYIVENHNIAGNGVGAVTLSVEKLTGTTALGSGSLITTFNLKSTANTPVTKSARDFEIGNVRQLGIGDRLAIKTTGTLTALEGVNIVFYIEHLTRGNYK